MTKRIRLEFDRGTILVHGLEPGVERKPVEGDGGAEGKTGANEERGDASGPALVSLPGCAFDRRVGLWRAPARHYRDVVTALTRDGIELEDGARAYDTLELSLGLELLPARLATLAILPLQMRLVYKIGKSYGFELDRGHVKDFLGVLGVGMASQMIEGFARSLVRGLLGRGLVGGLADQASGSAIAFGTTYALGHAAKRYYAGGRKLRPDELRELFTSIQLVGSKSLSSQPKVTGYSDGSKRVIGAAPLLPSTIPSQKLCGSLPSGVSAPRPVTTTRRRPFSLVTPSLVPSTFPGRRRPGAPLRSRTGPPPSKGSVHNEQHPPDRRAGRGRCSQGSSRAAPPAAHR